MNIDSDSIANMSNGPLIPTLRYPDTHSAYCCLLTMAVNWPLKLSLGFIINDWSVALARPFTCGSSPEASSVDGF